MKKPNLIWMYFISVLAVAIFGIASVKAQGSLDTLKWKFSNPKQFGFTILDVDFYDDNHAIAVGASGGIAFTRNGGTKWTYGPFVYTNAAGLKVRSNFNDVHFVTSDLAYAVGTGGCMAKTTDGGNSWSFITTPLFANNKNINAVWFINKDTGYIGGEYNSTDSIPKLYFTRNGGTTWDSINAPIGGKTVVGYINNPSLAPEIWDINSKATEIQRIEFINDSTGYISGSAYGSNSYPRHAAVSNADCLPNGTTIATSANFASLVWKFKSGTLIDYSLSKERLGYRGINTATVTCSTRFGQITPQTQTYKAMKIINDSIIVLMSFNNNIVVKVKTGSGDSTANINVPGYFEKGKYEILNFPFPPNGGTSIPNPSVLNASNPYHMKMDAGGALYAPCNFGLMWISRDTGRNWYSQASLPQGRNFSSAGTWAMDITPSGRFITMGTNGVVADSVIGGAWESEYEATPLSGSYFDIDFLDCNNGIAVGGPNITVTDNGGKTWSDHIRADFANLYISINSISYPALDKAWFSTSVGNIYLSPDQGVTMNPVFSDPNYQCNEIASVGPDTAWVIAYSSFSIPAANRSSSLLRTYDGGNTWQTITNGFPVGSTAPNLRYLTVPTSKIGYAAGNRNGVFKTSDGGNSWTDISPFPALNNAPVGFPNASVNYTDICSLDSNTVFVCGNMFTNEAVKRVYKTTDGGTTWTDITANIPQINPVGNLNAILMHDVNNGYVVAPGGVLMFTNNGGTSWNLDLAPTGSLFETMTFVPKKVPAGTPVENRKLFVCGANVNTGAPMMEYGDPSKLYLNYSLDVDNASCTAPSGGSVTITPSGGIAPYQYSINGGAFQSSNVLSGLSQGTDTVIVVDQSCQEMVKTIDVGFDDNLTLSVNNDTSVCQGGTVQLTAAGPGASYSWSPASGLSNAGISNPVATVSSSITYRVTAQLNGCVKTDSVNITLNAAPSVDAGPEKDIVAGGSVMLSGTSSVTPQTISWQPSATLTGSNTLTPIANPLTTTTYTLTVTDANGCSGSDTVRVNVSDICINIMDAFTPNGDGFNEKWMVTGPSGSSCARRIEAAVYNRYGGLIYRNDNYQNNWDGTYKGNPVPDGTYYYVLKFYLTNGKIAQKSGNVTVLR